MKKLIAIAVVFVLVAGAAFAVDLGGAVFGHVNVLEGNSGKDAAGDANPITASGGIDRARIDGSGEVADGAFGGYIRIDSGDLADAYAFWKPIDQFKLIIGGFSDAFWGKDGVTGWGFNQMPNDSGIATNPGIWCGGGWGSSVYSDQGYKIPDPDDPSKFLDKNHNGDSWAAYLHNRYVFLEGFQYKGLSLEIKPLDMLSINIGIPFMDAPRGNEFGDILQASLAQIDLNFDFGNIALTYDGANRAGMKAGDGGAFYVYYGGSFGALGLDLGFALHFAGAADADRPKWGASDAVQPIGLGLGLKFATDSFGVKFRVTAALGGDDEATYVNASLLPYFAINDNISAFLNAGIGMVAPSDGDTYSGFYVNPYLRVGAEWGPTFYFGFRLESSLSYDGKFLDGSDSFVNWSVPISLMVSF